MYTTATPIVRPLQRFERGAVLAVFAGLGERSRRLRFLGPKPRLGPKDVDALTDVRRGEHEAIVATDALTGRPLAIARFVRDSVDAEVAEIAFEVVDVWQGRGLGRRLARELGLRARRAGVRHLRATVELGNEPAFALLRRLGAIEEARYDGDVVEVLVAL